MYMDPRNNGNRDFPSVSPPFVESLREQMVILVKRNSKFSQSSSSMQGYFKCEATTALIFSVCRRLNQPLEVKYVACELYDRFMSKHIANLRQYVVETSKPNKRTADYRDILSKVKTQSILRILSCIQIASKLSLHYSMVNMRQVGNILRLAGNTYSTKIILNSELRVLKSLDFRVNVDTALTFLEFAVAILKFNNLTLQGERFQETCTRLLDVVYLRRSRIYSQLFLRITGKPSMTKQESLDFRPVETDIVLLGAAVLNCAVFLEKQGNFKQVTEQLSIITMLPCDDIMDFSAVIIEEIL